MRDTPKGAAQETAVKVETVAAARPSTVWRCLVEAGLLSRWLAARVELVAKVGAPVRIHFDRHHTRVEGVVTEVVPERRLAFTWGVAEGPSAAEMPPGSTRVSVDLEAVPGGTRIVLRHAGLPTEAQRRDHEGGWQGYAAALAGLAQCVPATGTPETLVDAWLAAWAEIEGKSRGDRLARIVTADATFRDAHAEVKGRGPISEWIAVCQARFPGVRMARDGDVLCARGSLLSRWKLLLPNGTVIRAGLTHLRLDAEGLATSVDGFWVP